MNTSQIRRTIGLHTHHNPGYAGKLKRRKWLVATLLATVASGLAAQDTTTPAAEGSVEVTVEGIDSTDGMIYASLFSSADGFPSDRDQAIGNESVSASEATGGTVVMTFAAIPAGVFAISILHDANSNGKLDTNFMGIPKEEYGFSQNPKSMFGPPSFDEATVSLESGEAKQLVITLE